MNFSAQSIPTVDRNSRYLASIDSPSATSNSPAFFNGHDVFIVIGNIIIQESHGDSLQGRFNRLKNKWLDDTRFTSSYTEIVTNPSYLSIIALGVLALPLILEDLRALPKPWFNALQSITGADPISADMAGNLKKMTAAWLAWGMDHGYLADSI